LPFAAHSGSSFLPSTIPGRVKTLGRRC